MIQGSRASIYVVDDYSGMPIEQLQSIVMDTFTLVSNKDLEELAEKYMEARNHEICRNNL